MGMFMSAESSFFAGIEGLSCYRLTHLGENIALGQRYRRKWDEIDAPTGKIGFARSTNEFSAVD